MLGDSLSMLAGVEKHHFTQRRTGYFGCATHFFRKKWWFPVWEWFPSPGLVKLACHVRDSDSGQIWIQDNVDGKKA